MIAMGCDHAGVELKEKIMKMLNQMGFETKDYGTYNNESVDYPEYAQRVGEAIISGECERGVLICGTGIGISIAANKVSGIRAAACSEPYSASMSRKHNNSNVLAIGARVVGEDLAMMIVREWINTDFEGGRHQRRVDLIHKIEKKA